MYQRFLTDNDYLSIVTKEAFSQLVHEVHDRVWEAEEASEASIVEYLHGKFEIEKALFVGKSITDYNPQITYPAGAHFLYDGKPVRALRTINGAKRPLFTPYWELIEEDVEEVTEEEENEIESLPENLCGDSFGGIFDDYVPFQHHCDCQPRWIHFPEIHDHSNDRHFMFFKARRYTQRKDYFEGQLVHFAGNTYRCLISNGPSFNDIRVPGNAGWNEIDVVDWTSLEDYEVNTVVRYEGKFYALRTSEGYDKTQNPKEASDDVWGQIAEYSESDKYEFSDTEWVVVDGSVFVPTMDPNPSELKEGFNFAPHDPRSPNIKKHLLRMAVYELHKLISPHNVSTARITDYEASLQWLQDVSRMRIDPGIPRCMDRDTHKPAVGYGLATFAREYNPYENEWQI